MTDNALNTPVAKPKARRGFASMHPDKRRAIARKGGASVPSHKRSFHVDRKLAASAGKLGGEASRKPRIPEPEQPVEA